MLENKFRTFRGSLIPGGKVRDKVVLVTGATSGIGEALVYQFAQSRSKVVVTWRRDELKAQAVAKEALRLGAVSTLTVQLDVTSKESIDGAITKVIQTFGQIDVLINNAGVLVHKFLAEQSVDEILTQLRTNLEGLILVTRICLPYLKDCVINIASTAGLAGGKSQTVYSATKFGVRGFTQALAKEQPNLRVYSINPSKTATRMTGFTGAKPDVVAEVVARAAAGEIRCPSGSDINVRDYTGRLAFWRRVYKKLKR